MSTKQRFLTLLALAPLASGEACAQQPTARKVPAAGNAVYLHRWVEPREHALTILVPEGWIAEGGVVRVDPRLGPTNSAGAKIEVAIKKDQAGSVMIHWLPNYTYKDPRALMGNFPVGSNYMGAVVYPLQDPLSFLTEFAFRRTRTQARNVQVMERTPLPEVAQKYQQRAAAPNIRYDAGAMTVAYDEGGTHYLEKMMAVIENVQGAGLGMWTNHETVAVRAPAVEFQQTEPLVSVIVASVKGNPQWIAGENRGAAQRAHKALESQRYLQGQLQQMVDDKRAVNAENRHSGWLFLTGQDDYVNPHTGEVEQGSNQYKHRWENSSGDVIYTDNPNYDPSRDNALRGRSDYKVTPLRPR